MIVSLVRTDDGVMVKHRKAVIENMSPGQSAFSCHAGYIEWQVSGFTVPYVKEPVYQCGLVFDEGA